MVASMRISGCLSSGGFLRVAFLESTRKPSSRAGCGCGGFGQRDSAEKRGRMSCYSISTTAGSALGELVELSPREFEIGCEWPTGRNRGVVSGAPVGVQTDRESRRRRARQRNCAEYRPETARHRAWTAARPVLSRSTRCSTGPNEWLPIGHGFRTNADQLGALDVRPLDHGEVISAEVTDGEAGGAVQGAVVVREADRADRRELDRRGAGADRHRD